MCLYVLQIYIYFNQTIKNWNEASRPVVGGAPTLRNTALNYIIKYEGCFSLYFLQACSRCKLLYCNGVKNGITNASQFAKRRCSPCAVN